MSFLSRVASLVTGSLAVVADAIWPEDAANAHPPRPRDPFVRVVGTGVTRETRILLVVTDEDGDETEHEIPVSRLEFVVDAYNPNTDPLRLYIPPRHLEFTATMPPALVELHRAGAPIVSGRPIRRRATTPNGTPVDLGKVVADTLKEEARKRASACPVVLNVAGPGEAPRYERCELGNHDGDHRYEGFILTEDEFQRVKRLAMEAPPTADITVTPIEPEPVEPDPEALRLLQEFGEKHGLNKA